MYLIIFNGNLIRDKIIVMAKFEGEIVENLKKRLRENDVLLLLREPEFNEFWIQFVKKYNFDIEMINYKISDSSFEIISKYIQDNEIDLIPFLSKNYDKNKFDCIALVEESNLLNILRTCSKLLIEFDYPTFYY